MIGITESVARASRQSSQKRTIAEPTRSRVFWTRVVTPSVTSWSRASTSFVRRLMITPARLRSKKPSESFWRCRKSLLRRSARMRSPVHPVKYVWAAEVARFAIPATTKSTTITVRAWKSSARIPSSSASLAR
jgi:hypothetical protein